MFNLNLNINNSKKARVLPLNNFLNKNIIKKGEKHDGISFVLHGMATKPSGADRWRFYESIHLSHTADSAGKIEKTIDFETEKRKGQKAQRQRQKAQAQAIGVSICCNQTIKAS